MGWARGGMLPFADSRLGCTGMTVLFGVLGALWILGRLAQMSSRARQSGVLGSHDVDEGARARCFAWPRHGEEEDDFWNPR